MMATLAFAVVFAAAAGVFIALPVLRKSSPTGDRLGGLGDERAHLELIERRDRALAALKELEFDHRTGTVSDVDYRALIVALRLEAAEALEHLEDVEFGAHRPPGVSKRTRRPRARLVVARDRR
jgi:hypothetical protein